MKDKNLEELIAAIGDDPAPAPLPTTIPAPQFNATSAGIARPVQARNVNPAPRRAQQVAAATAPRPYGSVAGSLDELVQYLGGNGSASVPASLSAPQPPAAQVPGFGRVPMMPAQQRQMSQHRTANSNARSAGQKLSAEFHRQQLQASKALQERASLPPSVSGHARAGSASSLAATKATPPQPPIDITAELTAVMEKAGSSSAARPAQRPVGVSARPPQRPQGSHPGNASGRPQRPQITQEQIIVGHFCRHAIKTLGRVMQNNPLKQQTEARGIDVIREFKTWYEREFELQKQRSNIDRRALQQQQQQLAQRQLAQQQRAAAPQQRAPTPQQRASAPQVKQQRKVQSARIAAPSRDQVLQAHSMQYPARGSNAGRPMAATNQAGRESQLGHPQFVKGEPQVAQQGNRFGGKTVSGKTVPSRKATVAKAAKNAAPKAVAGKSMANKSVGGKSISRPPPVSVTQGQVGVIGPSAPPAPNAPPAVSTGVVGGKGVTGSKGLLANKLPAGPKPKASRKVPVKGSAKASPSKGALNAPPPKAPGKVSPKVPVMKQKASPSAAPSAVPSPVASPAPLSVTGKRPLDTSDDSPVGSLLKKTKTTPKGQKGGPGRKKNVSFPSTGGPGKNVKLPPTKGEVTKGRPPSGTGAGSTAATAAGISAKSGTAGTSGVSATPGTAVRKVKRVDDELSVVHDVIDIDIEEDMLGRDAGGGTSEVIEIFDYDSDMLLAGPALRTKMQATAKRYGLDENISKDAMEIVSLAVHERLKNFLEALKGIAAVRVEESKASWSTETFGVSVYEKLERMREDEERSLTVAAELRVKRRKEQQEREAKKLAGEAEKEEKKTKDSSAAEQERKEKLALEKKRKEHSSQRDALSGLLAGIDKRRKKPQPSKTLAPLLPLLSKSGGSGSSGSGLPPIPRLVSMGALGNEIVNLGKKGLKVDTLEKLKALGPLVKLGGPRASSMPGSLGKKEEAPMPKAKQPLTLRDCLFFMESEHNTRKSSHIYKWYARLGATQQALKGQ